MKDWYSLLERLQVFLFLFLLPFSFVYLLATTLRRLAYRKGWMPSYHLGVRTLSVGNLSLGGTGKTPFIAYLLGKFESRGLRPLVLTRGYRSGLKADQAILLLAGKVVASRNLERWAGVQVDEASLLSRRFPRVPVVAGAQRRESYHFFFSEKPAA